ncbi:MAG: PIN domain-containing protein [Planctomycetota bacterium]
MVRDHPRFGRVSPPLESTYGPEQARQVRRPRLLELRALVSLCSLPAAQERHARHEGHANPQHAGHSASSFSDPPPAALATAEPGRHHTAPRCLVEIYTELLADSVELVAFNRAAAQEYARIRAATNLHQPDAIQLACAITGAARIFVTNDQRLWGKPIPGLDEVRGVRARG